MPELFTAGHGTLTSQQLADLLHAARVERVVDVRSHPGSRRNPQFSREELGRWLPETGIKYEWAPDLGGRRRPTSNSPNTGLRHPAFRAYADYMRTEAFQAGLERLASAAKAETVVVMCAEAVWWRCHRRLLADAATLISHVPVVHLFHDGRHQLHRPSPEVRLEAGVLVYDVGPNGQLSLPSGGGEAKWSGS
jgi:uncharacterized protein (DUF488 family)